MSNAPFPSDGTVLARGEDGYEEARCAAVWNGRKPDRYPAYILRAANDHDVVRAVRWAASADHAISVKSGGHSWVGNGLRDDTLLIDLGDMVDVEIDLATNTASVQPGITGRALNAALDQAGLVFPTGHCPTVAVGGFLLGGGYGWNSRHRGPACFSIVGADVVLADGQLVHATDESHPDLMWALRGAGPGFFGVVTRFRLRIYPRYRQILRSAYVFPRSQREEVLGWSYDAVASLPTRLEVSAKVHQPFPGQEQVTLLTAWAFCENEEDASLLDLLRSCPGIEQADCRVRGAESTMEDLYAMSDAITPPDLRWAVDGIWYDGSRDQILAAAQPVLDAIPTPDSFLLWFLWGGQPTRENSCWDTQAPLYFSPNAAWRDAGDDLRLEQWAHGSLRALEHLSRGTQFSDQNHADRPDRGISPTSAARLRALREQYDPTSLISTYLSAEESTTAYGQWLKNEASA